MAAICRVLLPTKVTVALPLVLMKIWLLYGWIYLSDSMVRCFDEFEDSFLCRQCGHDVAGPSNLKNIPSPYAVRLRNDTLLEMPKILIQLVENPSGAKFEIITATNVSLLGVSNWYIKDTWFPEYAWQIGVCPRCGRHLGWSFVQIDDTEKEEQIHSHTKANFTALILERLVPQNFADKLLVTSKMYQA